MQISSKLEFRRQFIVSSKKLTEFNNWSYTNFSSHSIHIYSHPEIEISTTSNSNKNIFIALIGFTLDPAYPNKSNKAILDELIVDQLTIDSLTRKISNLAGRFVFVIIIDHKKYAINDMCSLRSIYYSISNDQFYLASNPSIMKKVLELKPSTNYKTFIDSKHFKDQIEYWLPCGLTLYENVGQVIPNHYLDINNHNQIRFWPFQRISKQNLEQAAIKSADLLSSLILAAKNRFKLALPLTAGWDSRVLLSASKKYINELYLYTLQYRSLVDKSPDIKIPKYILRRYNIPYHQIDCRKEMDPGFYKIYKSNVDLAHNDWAKSTNGMKDLYPQERVVIRGNVSEIARCSFYPTGQHEEVTSASQLPVAWPEWKEIDFIMDYLESWIIEVKDICKENNIDIFDLWYWEIFMGSWQAQGQLEWDIIHEEFTPYNYRPLVETMLGVPIKYRLHRKSMLYVEIIKQQWPQLLYWPFNPPSWNRKHQFKYYIADRLKKIGLYSTGLKVYQITHPIYLKIMRKNYQ